MKYVHRADGTEANADDMPPLVRAFAFLVEHAAQRRKDGLLVPCSCDECEANRDVLDGKFFLEDDER